MVRHIEHIEQEKKRLEKRNKYIGTKLNTTDRK